MCVNLLGVWVSPRGCSCYPLQALLGQTLLLSAFCWGQWEIQLQEALRAWGLLSCCCTTFPVGRAQLLAGFLPCQAAGSGEGWRSGGQGLLFSQCGLAFWLTVGPAQFEEGSGESWGAGRSLLLVSVLPAWGWVCQCCPCLHPARFVLRVAG